ncbi:MAG: GNAT family N-acetyltransferase [Betaproteobacteria bacterium]|nr:GNAT family N-acetyltransferase [Betaproteobacteria bacterium]
MGVAIETARLIIATPEAGRAQGALEFVRRNAAHLKPWSPPAPDGIDTLDHWLGVVETAQQALSAGTAVRLWLSPHDDAARVIGSIGYSQIHRGVFCNATLGYQIDAQCEGSGLMREALSASNAYMFGEQKLHRIAANYRPENVRSGRLLQRLGFTIEGYAKDYLFIDGAWRDHILTSKVNPAFEVSWIAGAAPRTVTPSAR